VTARVTAPQPAAPSAPEPGPPPPRVRPWRLLLAGCFALAALSLVLPSVPTYDPWAWIIWGREIAHLDLSTVTGPSWKPFPVFFTTPFSVFGDDVAPLLWLVVARAGGLLAFAMAYRLGARLAGPVAGAISAVALILLDDFIFYFARGNSEAWLVALGLWAVERHLEGRRRDAFLLGIAASLIRPEVWPFIALYGGWLIAVDWQARRELPRGTVALVLGGGLSLIVLWFVPEYFGSGDFLRAASRAFTSNPDAPAYAKHPFLEVFRRSASLLSAPMLLGAVAELVWAARTRARGPQLPLAALVALLMLLVAAMAQIGFPGNMRYVSLPASFVCVLAGAGWVTLVRATGRRWGAVAAGALTAAALVFAAPFIRDDIREVDARMHVVAAEADLYGSVPEAIEAGGGAAKLKSCGTVYSGNFQTQTVAWYMHLHEDQVEIFPYPPGTTITPTYTSLARDPRFPAYAHTKLWTIGSSCPR
jgi:hypothetical protein